jgi:O-antigen/teichoic acid export membrane protein
MGFVVSNLAIAETLGRKWFSNYSKFFVLQKILLVVFAISLYYFLGINGVLYGIAISFVPYIYHIIRGFQDSRICFVLIRERLGFFLTSFVHTFAGVARGQVDKLVIAPILGFELLGNYSFALQIVAIFMIFPNVIYKYTVSTDAGNKSTVTVKKVTVLISVIISVAGFILSPIAISIFFPKYTLAIQAMQILSFHIIPATIGLMINSKFLGMEKNRLVLIGTIISLSVNISGVIILGPLLGIVGTSLAFVLSSTTNCAYLIIMNNKMKSDKSPSMIS